ncbi:hypothetical protein CRE_05161 [Caenorhabditis remanei]|uniref:Uncharacterized protein n=1 Tax=Caenorhabditis remanei TaxID=31234 RepID=E3N6D8_CAERE|nr:hypothetical protein CRE_05161 [Caenorhabditis remanei]
MKAIHFLEITAQEIFYDGTGIGGTICQNIDPSYLTAAEKEKMAELRRSQEIPEEVFQGYDPEALVKVKNLMELEEIKIEKQENAKKKAQENLVAERKITNFLLHRHLQHFYQMLATEMKGRGGVLWHLDVLQEEIGKLEKRNEDRSKRKKKIAVMIRASYGWRSAIVV